MEHVVRRAKASALIFLKTNASNLAQKSELSDLRASAIGSVRMPMPTFLKANASEIVRVRLLSLTTVNAIDLADKSAKLHMMEFATINATISAIIKYLPTNLTVYLLVPQMLSTVSMENAQIRILVQEIINII